MKAIEQQLFGHSKQARFERRGLMLDISRNRVPTMRCLEELVDALALLRYNELQLYTEHTFAYVEHPQVWRDASPITADEIHRLDAYCAERGIELVPNQNSFGHMERWLKHPPYRPLAECPDGFEHPIAGWRETGTTLFPSAESRDLIRQLYHELLPQFSSKQLHIGGDEPWELGQGRSRDAVAARGKHRVYLDFLKQLFQLAEAHAVRPQFWADIILEKPELVPELPRNVTPVLWGYDADSPYPEQCATVASAGFKDRYYVAPGAGNWNSFGGRLDIARANIVLAAQEGHRHQAKGLLLTAWGDSGHHQAWASLYPSLILAAQACWGSPMVEGQLPELIDHVFQFDPGNGAALCQLGWIDTLLPQPMPHISFLHSAFFADPDKLTVLLESTHSAALEETLAQLDSIDVNGIDSGIQLSIDMNRYALERCLRLRHNHSLHGLKERFEREWLRHSRIGGLKDSLGLFPLEE